MKAILRIFLAASFLVGIVSCAAPPKQKLVVFAAGSLIQPFSELEKAFEKDYPFIDVTTEYHGSIQVIRHVTDLKEKIDIVATADHSLIPHLMYSRIDPETNQPYANWYARFATNKMALAYTPKSKYAAEIDRNNWMGIIARPDVNFGLADPRFDASGYRTLMILSMCQVMPSCQGIFDQIMDGQFTHPIRTDTGGDRVLITVPEVLEPVENSRITMRGGSIQLLSLLESGDVDYAFEYESVINQHNLNYIELPDEMNLGNPQYDQVYGLHTVKMDFQRFKSLDPEFAGEAIGYGIVIPPNAPNPQAAAMFLEFLYSEDGESIMKRMHQPIIFPPDLDFPSNAPIVISSMVQYEEP